MAITQGIAYWANVQKPVANFNRDGFEYTIDLHVDDTEANKLKEAGVNIREKDGELVAKFKKKAERNDGSKNTPPKVVDADNVLFDKEIGNGSKVRVQYRIYEWEFGRKKGKSADLQAVQVVDFVPRAGGSNPGDEFEALSNDVPF